MAKVKFGDVVKEVKNKIDRNNNPYEFYVAGDHMDTDSLSIPRRGSFLTDDVGPAFIREFKEGQVLYGSRRTYLRKVAVADFDGVTANTTFVLETKDENVLRQRLLPFIMYTEGFTAWSIKKSRGSTNPYVLFKDLADYEFDLPSIKEQDKLAEVLWSINDTLQAYQNLLTQTDALVQAQFVEMFGDLDANTKNYPVKKLSDIASYWNGLTYKPSDEVKSNKEGILVLRSSNIQNGVLNFEDNVFVSCEIKERLFVKENDILMCVRNGSANLVGKTAMINNLTTPMTFGAFMMIIRSEYYPFLKTYFETPFFRNRITTGTSTINQITTKMLNQIHIPIPDLDKVEQFDDFVCQAASSKSTLQKTITSLQATKRCILETALGNRGKE